MNRLWLCLTPTMSLVATFAWAQNAQVSGRVVDQGGGVVPTAKIVVLNEGTGVARSTDTNGQGFYVVSSLLPGTYNVSVHMSGFRALTRAGVTLEVGQNARLDFTLEPASTQEEITVSADASRINVTDGSVGTVINRRFVENVPMNGRSFQSLVLLTPGIVTNTPQSFSQAGFAGEVSVNGQRTESNRFTVDGVSANNGTGTLGYSTAGTNGGLATGTAMGTTQSLVSLDALQEFRVTSSSYSAEFGRSPGGQISFVTRSGTNALHGSLFEYVRNDTFDANDFFNNRLGVAKPRERQNDFGGTLGGPVALPRLYDGRNRTFFFASYEGLRVTQPLPATVGYVPSLALRQGTTGALRDVLNSFPLPTGADLPNGLSEYLITDSLPSHVNSIAIRVDHNLTASHRLFVRHSSTPSEAVARGTGFLADYNTTRFEPRSDTFGVSSVLSNRMTNELRVGYASNEGSIDYQPIDKDGAIPADLFQQQGIDLQNHPSAAVFMSFQFSGTNTAFTRQTTRQRQTQLNVTDALDVIIGRHRLKFGADLLRTASTLQRTEPSLTFIYSNRDAVLQNRASTLQIFRYGRTQPIFMNAGLFAQDEWRLAARLGVSLGVRWEITPAPEVSDGTLPRVPSGSVTQPATLGLAPEGTSFWSTSYRNVAPRVGLAYVARDSANYETVVRAGGGIFFDGPNTSAPIFSANPGTALQRNFGSTVGTEASYPQTPAQWDVPLEASLVPPYRGMYAFGDPTAPYKQPYTYQWNLSVEQAIRAHQSLTVSYVGARGRRLFDYETRNLSSFNKDFTTVTVVGNRLTSSYDALQANFHRRMSHGFQALASYTWSHSIDYGSDNTTLPAKRGDSAFDVRHNLGVAASYDVPAPFENKVAQALLKHWSLDGRFTARTAFPVTLNGATLTDPTTGRQFYGGLDLITGVPLYLENSDAPGGRQINPAAFKLPVGSQVGTAPRNFVRGFGATQLDAALHRDFTLSGALRLQARVEAFNILNHANLGFINTTFGNAQFGLATKMLNSSLGGLNPLYQQGGPRSMQLSVRAVF
jgi:hypothetical protein